MANLVASLAWSSLLVLRTDLALFWLEGDETPCCSAVHRRTCKAVETEVTLTKFIFGSNRGRVCQGRNLMSPKRQKTRSVDTTFCLQHPSTNLTVFAPRCSKLTFKHSPTSNINNLVCVCVPVSLLPDYGADRPRVREQRSHQHRRGSQFPEVPSHVLPPEPVIPPHWRGLGPGVQPRPKGEIVATAPAWSRVSVSWLDHSDQLLSLQNTFSSVQSAKAEPHWGGVHWLLSVCQSPNAPIWRGLCQ